MRSSPTSPAGLYRPCSKSTLESARPNTRFTTCALSVCRARARGLWAYSVQHLMNFGDTLSHHCSSSPVAAYITVHCILNGVWHWIHRALSRAPRPLRAMPVSGALAIANSGHKCTSARRRGHDGVHLSSLGVSCVAATVRGQPPLTLTSAHTSVLFPDCCSLLARLSHRRVVHHPAVAPLLCSVHLSAY